MVQDERRGEGGRRAFRLDAAAQRGKAAAKAAWWTAAGGLAKFMTRPAEGKAAPRLTSESPPLSRARLRRAYFAAFEKDAADVAAGLYPPMEDAPADPAGSILKAWDFLADAREVDQRRRRGDGVEVRDDPKSQGYPAYYRQNFHYQSGGWFTAESARRYDAQVEALFSGAAGAMRRRALSLLARQWRGRDQRALSAVDVACGSGAFLRDLAQAFPRAALAGVDLSPAYLSEARTRSGRGMVQANAEHLPFADRSLDAVTCVYLFHELPPRVRPIVAAEIARVLKPGGVLAFADSVQPSDEPQLARMLEVFPAYFHEPFYGSYAQEDLEALFGAAGLRVIGRDKAFLTKALLLEK
ncbi:SAM-dependent methyltransferase [Caulobacter sp. D5]|uniref:class I SAM-dependent methyltransferase n=2 Tax=unclassified Caulobacter TaxID=2648921 RepID=UPI000D73D781|nr:class I SAM-dependent methyltransferase [Caulobacter sp. D5]PXA82656.1 SAM-dependent methyltransferase [Caulobacter sp. D5]